MFSGVPTSRAASITVSDDKVWRDQFYDGHPALERTAVVLRLAKSWFRIGSFEILSIMGETAELRILADFVIKHHFKDIDETDSGRYLDFFSQVVSQTANLIAMWMAVGFAHGVCNTDNFSIIGITIDYGPFRFMDNYDPEMVPNTSDDEHRYTYEKQPDVGLFNLKKLADALEPILKVTERRQLTTILKGYSDIYKSKFMNHFRSKLGLLGQMDDDENLIAILLKMMSETKTDFTLTFRQLGHWPMTQMMSHKLNSDMWALLQLAEHTWFWNWVDMYIERINAIEEIADHERMHRMKLVNPRYVLRNWMVHNVIKSVEEDNYKPLFDLLNILKNPFIEQPEAEKLGYASKPPGWTEAIRVSCSS